MRLVLTVVMALVLSGCADEESGLMCGPGTVEEGGACVMDPSTPVEPGAPGPGDSRAWDGEPESGEDTAGGMDLEADTTDGTEAVDEEGTDAQVETTESGVAEDAQEEESDAVEAPETDAAEEEPEEPVVSSAGCGLPTNLTPGGVQLEFDAGEAGDGIRGYYLSLPANYDPTVPHDLIVGFAGRDSNGQNMQWYLGLEGGGAQEIFVYPDPLVRQFDGWGEYGGWLLGPNAGPATGMGDLNYTEALLNHLEETYCINTSRVFVTGHSWGGDMTHVVSCFLGDRFTAAVPTAANQPYWFNYGDLSTECLGSPAVWTYFGIADDAFGNNQAYPGDFGDQCRDFWLGIRGCDGVDQYTELPDGEAPGECVEYTGCSSPVRYCLYGPATGHQVPPYYSGATIDYFRNFPTD